MCVFRLRSVSALLLSLSLSSVFMFCAKKSGQDAAPPAAAVAPDNVLADARDGKKYKTVKIGEQVWMAENLNYQADEDGSRCYNDSASYCDKYGRLYEWKTAKTVCPAGWKLPDTADWNKLVTAAGGEKTAGKKLKSKSGWKDEDGNDGNGTDEFGFSALPSGFMDNNPDSENGAVFAFVGNDGFWWTATENGNEVYDRVIHSDGDNVFGYSSETRDSGTSNGYSVRCLKE